MLRTTGYVRRVIINDMRGTRANKRAHLLKLSDVVRPSFEANRTSSRFNKSREGARGVQLHDFLHDCKIFILLYNTKIMYRIDVPRHQGG